MRSCDVSFRMSPLRAKTSSPTKAPDAGSEQPADSVEHFVKTLKRSKLLTSKQLRIIDDIAGPVDSASSLARCLVAEGLLTRWQGRQLLAGYWRFFLGKYRLLESIGKGGMGTVYRAEQPGLNRIVALKVMSSSLLNDQSAVSRFQREMRAVGSLNHPNFVVAHDAGSVGSNQYLVMECIEGRSLRDWIEQGAPLPVEWATEVIRQTAAGLQHAFLHHLIHRDIKPSNILIVGKSLDRRPTVKILDMGLARFAHHGPSDESSGGYSHDQRLDGLSDSITLAGQIMGSPLYIAPEQAQNSSGADIRADIYGMGATLFEMLTGQPPIRRDHMIETIRAKLYEDAPRCSQFRPEIDPRLDDVVAKMLTRDPAERFQTPGEVAVALADFSMADDERAAGRLETTDVADHQRTTQSSDDTLAEFIDQVSEVNDQENSMARQLNTRREVALKNWKVGIAAAVGLVITGFGVFAFSGGSSASESDNSHSDSVAEAAGEEDLHRLVDRRVAEWALSVGGRVQVFRGETTVDLVAGATLPSGGIRIAVLDLEGVQSISTSEAAQIGELKSLRVLNLKSTSVTDQHLVELAELPSIERLNLALAHEVTNEGVQSIAGLTSLKELDLSFTDIGDEGIEQLSSMIRLELLNLSLTQISNEAVPMLGRLMRLKVVDLRDTAVTDEGIRELSLLLPKCQIH